MMPTNAAEFRTFATRRSFIGGSDARVIMGDDEEALFRLWHEKRGEAEPPEAR
jgi:predicted phage-related endonuclease